MGTGETAFFAANFAVEVKQIQGDASMFLEIMPATSSPGERFLDIFSLNPTSEKKQKQISKNMSLSLFSANGLDW